MGLLLENYDMLTIDWATTKRVCSHFEKRLQWYEGESSYNHSLMEREPYGTHGTKMMGRRELVNPCPKPATHMVEGPSRVRQSMSSLRWQGISRYPKQGDMVGALLKIHIPHSYRDACGVITPTAKEGSVKTSKRPCEETLFIL